MQHDGDGRSHIGIAATSEPHSNRTARCRPTRQHLSLLSCAGLRHPSREVMPDANAWLPLTKFPPLQGFAAAASCEASRTPPLVTTFAYGHQLTAEASHRFMGTLRLAGYKGAITIFVGGDAWRTDAELQAAWARYGARHKPMEPLLGDEREAQGKRRNLYVWIQRPWLAAGECRRGGHCHCLIADFRDIYFQADPMARYPRGSDLVLFGEAQTYGQSGHTGQWIKRCFGHMALRRMKNETIICAGTIAGTPWGLSTLGAQMNATFHERMHTLKWRSQSGCIDQGVMDYLLFRLRHTAPLINRSEASPFLSLADLTTIQERGRGGMVNTVGKLITEGSLRLGEDGLDARGFGHLACMRGPTRV